MAIIRTKRPENFTVINNSLINDPSLDWRDLGLLTYLLSKPDNWEVSVAHLQKIKKSSRDAIYASMKALTVAGYATGRPNPKGGFVYEIYDTPINMPLTENPFTENPLTENPLTEIPLTENPPQVNTDIQQILKEQQRLTKSKGDAPKFQKPTADEVSAFCLDSGITIDVQHFLDYYESNGWRVGRNPMKNWQATVRNWAKNETKFRKPANTYSNQPAKPASEYRYVPSSAPREFDNAIDSYVINGSEEHDTKRLS